MAITYDWTAETGAYSKQALTDDDEYTFLDDQQAKNMTRGCVMFVHSTAEAGTLKVYFIDRDDTDRLLQSTPVGSDSLTAVDFDFHLPRYKITWTTTASAATTVFVEVFQYGATR